jgi:hypothetical protein
VDGTRVVDSLPPVKRTTKAFWQGVFASIVASLLLEGVKYVSARAESAAAEADVDVAAALPPLSFLDDLSPLVRLTVVAGAGFALGLLVFLLLQRIGVKLAAMVLPTVAVLVVGVVYLWLM